MSVTAVNPISSVATEGEDGNVDYDVVLEVITDSRLDGSKTVLAHSGVPKRGDPYSFSTESDPSAACRTRSATTRDINATRKVWRVSLKYSSKGSSQDPASNSGGDPIDFGWHVSLSTNSRMVAPDKDRNDRPFVNTALEPFLPPPEKEEKYPVLRFTKNATDITLTRWADAVGKVNSIAMWGLDDRCVKLVDWSAEPHYIGPGVMYWSQTFLVEIKFSGFYFQPPNMGHRELAGVRPDGTVVYRAILDDLKIPLARPVPLDINGVQLLAPADPLFFDQAAGAFKKFEIEDEYDLGIILPPVLPGNFT